MHVGIFMWSFDRFPERSPSAALAPLYGLFDVIVDGVNITARITDGFSLSLLADLAVAVAGIAQRARRANRHPARPKKTSWSSGSNWDADDVLVILPLGPAPRSPCTSDESR